MGRRSDPAAVKVAKGNPGRRPIAAQAQELATGGHYPAPRNLKVRERELWKSIAPELAQLRLLRPTDLPAFRRYIVLLAKWDAAEKLLRPAKLVQVTHSEHVQNLERISKGLMVAIMVDKRLSEIEDRFGMNPAARQGLLMKMANSGTQPGLPLEARPGTAAPPPPDALPTSPIGLLN